LLAMTVIVKNGNLCSLYRLTVQVQRLLSEPFFHRVIANSNLTGLDLPMIAEESWVNID